MKPSLSPDIDPRWASIAARDKQADGQFVYAVISTGIYCRPSCAARLPRPENVRFFTDCDAAEAAGFRACKRCKPRELSQEDYYSSLIVRACRYLENEEKIPSLAQIAAQVGLNKDHFQKLFKQQLGVTPKVYAQAQRAQKLREELSGGAAVADAIYAAGYNSQSRFYEKADEVLGMTASDYRAGGKQQQIRFAVGECSLGSILVAQSERGICAILLGDDPQELIQDLEKRFAQAELLGAEKFFENVVAQVIGFIDAPQSHFNLPLDIRGTAFQQRVWQALCKIPVGTTASYTEIAVQMGTPKAFRAVAQACAANALAVVIPCHRVVRSDGGLSGYRWGVERKRALLLTEKHSNES